MMTVVNEIDFDKHCLMSFEEMIEAIARVADKLTDKQIDIIWVSYAFFVLGDNFSLDS